MQFFSQDGRIDFFYVFVIIIIYLAFIINAVSIFHCYCRLDVYRYSYYIAEIDQILYICTLLNALPVLDTTMLLTVYLVLLLFPPPGL